MQGEQVTIKCPECGAVQEVLKRDVRTTVRCPKCKELIIAIPMSEDQPNHSSNTPGTPTGSKPYGPMRMLGLIIMTVAGVVLATTVWYLIDVGARPPLPRSCGIWGTIGVVGLIMFVSSKPTKRR